MPEPPIGAVRQALVWVLERSVSQRLVEFARSAAGAGEEGQDALYAVAGRLLGPYRAAADPVLVRAALKAGQDVPEAEGPDIRGVVHLVAAVGLGAQEVGADALAEAFAAFGMFGLMAEDWAQMLGAAERGEAPPVDWGLLEQRTDVVGAVKRAGDEELVRARTVLVGLSGFYGLYVMHGLLMPDTPALAALRQRIDDFGMFPFLDRIIAVNPSPTQYAETLAVCLHPLLDNLYEALMEQLAADPGVFRVPGDERGPAGFMETVLLDSGTTCLEIARTLRGRHVTVMPLSLQAIHVLSGAPEPTALLVPGGRPRAGEGALTGPLTLASLSALRFDTAVLGCCGLTAGDGMTAYDLEEAAVKKAVITSARRIIAAADGSKLGRTAHAYVGPSTVVDVLVTDTTAPADETTALENSGTAVRIV